MNIFYNFVLFQIKIFGFKTPYSTAKREQIYWFGEFQYTVLNVARKFFSKTADEVTWKKCTKHLQRKQTQNFFWCCSCYFQLTALYLVHMVLSSMISVGFLVIQKPEMNLSDSHTLYHNEPNCPLQNSSLERDILWKITIYCKESCNWLRRRPAVTV